MPLAIDHINIVVSDLEKSFRFYTELLGFRESKRAHLEGEWIEVIVGLKGVVADVAFIHAPAGEPRIEFLCYKKPKGEAIPANSIANTVGIRHIALRVDDIYAAAGKLKNAGVKLLGEPVIVPRRSSLTMRVTRCSATSTTRMECFSRSPSISEFMYKLTESPFCWWLEVS